MYVVKINGIYQMKWKKPDYREIQGTKLVCVYECLGTSGSTSSFNQLNVSFFYFER